MALEMFMLTINQSGTLSLQCSITKSPVCVTTLINQCVIAWNCQRFGIIRKPDGNIQILEEQKVLINSELAVSSLMLFSVQWTSS